MPLPQVQGLQREPGLAIRTPIQKVPVLDSLQTAQAPESIQIILPKEPEQAIQINLHQRVLQRLPEPVRLQTCWFVAVQSRRRC